MRALPPVGSTNTVVARRTSGGDWIIDEVVASKLETELEARARIVVELREGIRDGSLEEGGVAGVVRAHGRPAEELPAWQEIYRRQRELLLGGNGRQAP